MNMSINVWCLVAMMAALMACSSGSMVVLVPDPDGSVGKITVSNDAGSVTIDQANHATVVRDRQSSPAPVKKKDPGEIDRLFGPVLGHQPLPPVHFILYFKSGSRELSPESGDQLPAIVSAIDARIPTRVSVVGHTDTMGDKQYNLRLSMGRAQSVKALLVERGVDEETIEVTSHGEENPLVKTADNVANAKNRRVEVVVR